MPFDLVEYDDAVVLIPMTAPVNCRDVTSTLINDATAVDLLKFSTAHAIFGRVGSKQERFNHKMKPTFNGTADYEGQSPFFSTKLDFDSVKKKIVAFLTVLMRNNSSTNELFSINSLESSILEQVNQSTRSVGTTALLQFFLTSLDTAYDNFNSSESYRLLNDAACNAMIEYGMDRDVIETLIYPQGFQIPLEVRAIGHFQNFMTPFILSLPDGNHRHMRLLLGMLGCNEDFVVEPDIPGFKLRTNITSAFDSASNPFIGYHFYDLKDASKSSCDYSIEEIQCLSYNMSKRLEESTVAGFCPK